MELQCGECEWLAAAVSVVTQRRVAGTASCLYSRGPVRIGADA